VQADLGFRVGGKIVRRPVDIGQHVTAGQILAALDPVDLAYSAQSAEAGLRSAEASAAQAAADLRRYEQLGRSSPAYLPSEYDRRVAASQVAQANVTQAQRQLSLARDQVAYGTLTADADGIVTAVPAQIGQVMQAGQTVVALAHSDEIEIVADVPENRLADLRAASDIKVKLWALPDLQLRATLRELGGLADAASRTFAAKLSITDAPRDRLALGMTATVVVSRTGPDIAILPAGAITDQDGQPAVWVLDTTSHHATKRRVMVAGYDQDGHVVIGSGLNAGEKVVTAGAQAISAEMKLAEWAGAVR
jgi:RND family efflux transporter MFP subunit